MIEDISLGSASRLTTAVGCAKKYQFQYVDKIPQKDGGSFILGNAVHNGLERWWELEDGLRKVPGSLLVCVEQCWDELLPPGLKRRVDKELAVFDKVAAITSAIKLARPSIVNVSATKDYKTAPEVQELMGLTQKTLNWLEANSSSIRWSKAEPPIKTWAVMLAIAQRLEDEWISKPRPYMVENSFSFEHEGFEWRGRIDVYGPIDSNGELTPKLIDWKSGVQMPTQMDYFFQATVYHLAMTQHFNLPIDEIEFFMLRPHVPVTVKIVPEKHYPLLFKYRQHMENAFNKDKIFLPSYSFACKMCDYQKFCAAELDIFVNKDKDNNE